MYMRNLVLSLVLGASFVVTAFAGEAKKPKYVFLFIGDGMSVPQRMMANEFSIVQGNGPLAMNMLPITGMARTRSANNLVTDSAASGTAIACGVKTRNGRLGVDENGEKALSCAEVAKLNGLKVGILSTVMITHATPASFYAHRKSRSQLKNIIDDLFASNFDYFAGGGFGMKGEKEEQAIQAAISNGYKVVRSKEAFEKLKPGEGKVIMNFNQSTLPHALDWRYNDRCPRMPRLVEKAVELLDNDKGFFIMCEAGLIDWGCHGNEAATVLHNILALDESVKIALKFAEKHPDETLIVVTGDHETGSMTMGFTAGGNRLRLERLAQQTMSIDRFHGQVAQLYAQKKGDVKFEDVGPLIGEAFGYSIEAESPTNLVRLTESDIKSIKKAFDADMKKYRDKVEETKNYLEPLRYSLGNACSMILMQKAGVAWGSDTHSSLPAMTTAKGVMQEKFAGFYENDHIGKVLKSCFSNEK
ncbi:MAG: alkaline phosphatase [Kiritimatiellae bacterium]|nr:alkaline phosphatase [Kiritimatiellia bacterium]